MLPQTLGPIEVRVLGSLIEKALSTPDHYPLSLNSLVAACNQSSNRDPVMSLDTAAVSHALDLLRRQSLVRSFQGSGERVPKFQHLLADADDLSRAELAVLCVLTLRGPQTMAEVSTRASRLVPHEPSAGIQAALDALITREPVPAATRLPRRPGQKEQRYAHLLGGDVTYEESDVAVEAPVAATERFAALEQLTHELRNEVSDLRAQLDSFRKQFE
ncbi:MAG: YceH family protein [Gemmatimonadaceae bacterium]